MGAGHPVRRGIPRSTADVRLPRSERRLTRAGAHGLLRNVTDTYTRLWRRVHMDLVRYAGCVCRPSR
ncbi:putative leader peptide [Streptomyces sp. NBC_01431]|uniref:putative leader peptide n=1 Tax=Streptomyces sp. NBC_01431 TaxID=2903863 RepID=UPI002E348D02|nr:putative leader peptide [Streptomyces sp. NBC_01431]